MTEETAQTITDALGKAEPFVAPLNPLIPMGLTIVEALIRAEPKLEHTLRALFSKPSLTTQDFLDAINHIELTTYEKLCPHSELRPEPERGDAS